MTWDMIRPDRTYTLKLTFLTIGREL